MIRMMKGVNEENTHETTYKTVTPKCTCTNNTQQHPTISRKKIQMESLQINSINKALLILGKYLSTTLEQPVTNAVGAKSVYRRSISLLSNHPLIEEQYYLSLIYMNTVRDRTVVKHTSEMCM